MGSRFSGPVYPSEVSVSSPINGPTVSDRLSTVRVVPFPTSGLQRCPPSDGLVLDLSRVRTEADPTSFVRGGDDRCVRSTSQLKLVGLSPTRPAHFLGLVQYQQDSIPIVRRVKGLGGGLRARLNLLRYSDTRHGHSGRLLRPPRGSRDSASDRLVVGRPLAATAGLTGSSGDPVRGVVRLLSSEREYSMVLVNVGPTFFRQFVLSCSYVSRP